MKSCTTTRPGSLNVGLFIATETYQQEDWVDASQVSVSHDLLLQME